MSKYVFVWFKRKKNRIHNNNILYYNCVPTRMWVVNCLQNSGLVLLITHPVLTHWLAHACYRERKCKEEPREHVSAGHIEPTAAFALWEERQLAGFHPFGPAQPLPAVRLSCERTNRRMNESLSQRLVHSRLVGKAQDSVFLSIPTSLPERRAEIVE